MSKTVVDDKLEGYYAGAKKMAPSSLINKDPLEIVNIKIFWCDMMCSCCCCG
jgi:hypothetical protein